MSTLSRVAKIIDKPKCKLIHNSFMSNFKYSPLRLEFMWRKLLAKKLIGAHNQYVRNWETLNSFGLHYIRIDKDGPRSGVAGRLRPISV